MARDMLYDRLFRYAVRIPKAFDRWERDFRGLPIFDITSALTAIESLPPRSWDALNQIIKRPPFDRVWVEYTQDRMALLQDGSEAKVNVTTGFYVWRLPEGYTYNDEMTHKHYLFAAVQFEVWNNSDKAATPVGVPYQVGHLFKLGFSENWQGVTSVCWHGYQWDQMFPGCPYKQHDDVTISSPNFDDIQHPIKAFALLNCRNVVTEDVHPERHGPTTNPRVPGEKKPRPLCSYKVLKLEVPRRVAERHGDDVEREGAGEPKVRFHLCRGHVKWLMHPRYKTPGPYWWPEHWKGSIALGRADKSYELRAADPA